MATKGPDAAAAAQELVIYTGDKTQSRRWQVGDAIAALADPGSTKVPSWAGRTVRENAINVAKHEDFLSAARLTKLGQIALDWPVSDRVAGVSIDAHGEALSGCGGDRAKAAKALANIVAGIANGSIRSKTGVPSIRNVRDHLGLNGGTRATKPLDLGTVPDQELWYELNRRMTKGGTLSTYLRGALADQGTRIKTVHRRLAELVKVMEDIAAAKAPKTPKAPASPKPVAQPAEKKKGRIAGL